jgi:hypothetical protein
LGSPWNYLKRYWQKSQLAAAQAQEAGKISIMRIIEMGAEPANEDFFEKGILFHLSFKMR